jgi:hypothetical protein
MGTSIERRAGERSPCEIGIYCRSIYQDQSAEYWPATVLDLSVSGLGLLAERRFEKGSLLFVELQDDNDHPLCSLLTRVVRYEKRPGGRWLLGCVLTSKLSEEDVQSLLELSKLGTPAEAVPCAT